MVKVSTFNGTTFRVGQSAKENWAIIAAADKSHYWLHLEGVPSAHVIIEIDVEPTDEEIAYAVSAIRAQTPKAPLAAGYIMTTVKNLKFGSKPGAVIVCKEMSAGSSSMLQ
jgi:hypothetical protein